MNILHITDFHYSDGDINQTKMIDSIIELIKSTIRIDLIFFTGDLVKNGTSKHSFHKAGEVLFGKLSQELNVEKENVIFCPGNHDIDRTQIHSALASYFESNIRSEDELNFLYSQKNDYSYIDSLKPSANFRAFLESYFERNSNNIFSDLYSIHYREINSKKLAIVCLNSAWISSIDKSIDKLKAKDDKGNLLIPSLILKEIKANLLKVDLKIALVHHPLYFLKDYNFNNIENYVHNEFDLMFSGHVHKISSLASHNGSNGIFEHIAKASLSAKGNLGCSIVCLDEIEENKITVKEITYVSDSNFSTIAPDVIHTIPHGIEKEKTIAFRKKIFEKIAIEKDNANKLLLLKEDEKLDFIELYNSPILKKEMEGGLATKTTPNVSLEKILLLDSNYLILGKDKCGKTSLLKRIQLDFLINYSKYRIIPFYFDAKDYENKLDDKFELEQKIRDYFSVNREKTNDILASNYFLLLIDNYSQNSAVANYLNEFLKKYPTIRYIVCAENNISSTVDIFKFGNSIYEKLFFHDLRRQEIIEYTEKRLSSAIKKEEVQQKIIQLCKQLELPLNYWTISLLLLIYNKSANSYTKNLFSVLDVCIDQIFNKKAMIIANSRISFDQLKTICSELAKHLFKEYPNSTYSASATKITQFIDEIILENDRISTTGRDVFSYLLSCGLLKVKEDNENYVFRLNGFFEYFLALQMTRDEEFKSYILDDEVRFLAFKNQLEIYSGFVRDDIEFLENIFRKTTSKLSPTFKDYNTDKDSQLLDKVKEPQLIEEVCRNISVDKALTPVEKAKLEDMSDDMEINADVHIIKSFDTEIVNSELIERYLSILSRIFRNSDEIKGKKDKIKAIFDEILNLYCDLSFFIIDEFSSLTREELTKDMEIEIENFPELDLLKFISNFIPLISQSSLFDGLGHYNLERMIKQDIEKYEADPGKNQYKLFLLYFLLLDIDLNSNLSFINRALSNIKMPILKYAIVVKLNFYLAFKSADNKLLQKELSSYIQKAQLFLDNSTDLSSIQKHIQEKKRLSQINK